MKWLNELVQKIRNVAKYTKYIGDVVSHTSGYFADFPIPPEINRKKVISDPKSESGKSDPKSTGASE